MISDIKRFCRRLISQAKKLAEIEPLDQSEPRNGKEREGGQGERA